MSRPALGPTQPPIQWVPGVLSPGVLSPGVKARPGRDADHSPYLVPRSRMSRSYTSSPPNASMACSGTALPFYLYISYCTRFFRHNDTEHHRHVFICTIYTEHTVYIYIYVIYVYDELAHKTLQRLLRLQ
jgi:hypothetical protein